MSSFLKNLFTVRVPAAKTVEKVSRQTAMQRYHDQMSKAHVDLMHAVDDLGRGDIEFADFADDDIFTS
jgi:hypothetical protein